LFRRHVVVAPPSDIGPAWALYQGDGTRSRNQWIDSPMTGSFCRISTALDQCCKHLVLQPVTTHRCLMALRTCRGRTDQCCYQIATKPRVPDSQIARIPFRDNTCWRVLPLERGEMFRPSPVYCPAMFAPS